MDRSSLRGTEVDGGASFDANGEMVLDLALRRLFDYHLSLIGERDLPQIRQLLADYLLGRFDPRKAATVLGYFDRYAGYRQRLGESKIGEAADPRERLANAMALRRQILGDAMATAFFAEEEALAALTLKRMDIAGDADRCPEVRTAGRTRPQRFDATEQRRSASLEAVGQLNPGG